METIIFHNLTDMSFFQTQRPLLFYFFSYFIYLFSPFRITLKLYQGNISRKRGPVRVEITHNNVLAIGYCIDQPD